MARFRHARTNVVESDDGVTIEVMGRTGIRYTEGDRTCVMFSETLVSSEPAMAVRPSDVRRWEPPNDEQHLTDSDRERILANVAAAFESQGWRIVIG